MLAKIELINFKSFLKSALDLRPLTVLTGPNNSGKSSIIQAIRMVFRYYISQKQYIDLPDHVSPRLQKSKLSKDNFFNITLKTDSNEIFDLHVDINGELYAFDRRYIQRRIGEVLQYVSAARLGPQNILELNPEFKAPEIGIKAEYIIDYIDKHRNIPVNKPLIRDKNNISRLWENINAWLQYISPGTVLSYEIKREQNASYPYYDAILPTETGYGLSYTLPIITALLVPTDPGGSVVLIENPEAHLHPKGQTAIGELIALTASAGKQVVVETHSDHLIDGIRIAARNKKIQNTDTVFHYFSRGSYDSETTIESPVLKQDGKLSYWPEGFFDQSLINKAELLKNEV
jgi:predicted ATPase